MAFDYSRLQHLRKNDPTWRLLTADHAALIVAFVDLVFREPNTRSIGEADLVTLLDDYLHGLRQIEGESAFPRDATFYLTEWAQADRGWLRKFYPPGTDEAHFDITPATEKALQWVDSLAERPFVGTESRLTTAVDLLRRIVDGVEMDADTRVARLEAERREIDQRIAAIRAGHLPVLDERALREHFVHFSRIARELLSDFRAVEHNFRELDRRVREQIAGWTERKSALLQSVFGEHDAITDSDEGRSFRAFWDFLMSPAGQEELSALLDRIYELEALGNLREDRRFKRIHYDWITAGEQTQRTVARLSQQLRRFLDDQTFLENRRIIRILDQITRRALEVRHAPPSDPGFSAVPGVRAEISLPFERPLFRAPEAITLTDAPADDQPPDIDTTALFDRIVVDSARLERNIRGMLTIDDQVTLAEVVQAFPLQEGLLELVTYLTIAAESPLALIDDERRDSVEWTDREGRARRAHVPRVIFQKGTHHA